MAKKKAVKKSSILGHIERTHLVSLKNAKDQVGSTISVPGEWWEHNQAEHGKIFQCTVEKWVHNHEWSNSNAPLGAFFVKVEGRTEDPYPMSLIDYSKFVRQRATASATPARDATVSDGQPAPSEQAPTTAPDNTPAVPKKGFTSPLWKFCVPLEIVDEDGKTHVCKICRTKLTQHKKSTSGLINHFKNKHPPEYEQIMSTSIHSKQRVNVDGDVVVMFSFQESLEHHIRFVIWCVLKKRPFFIALDQEFRDFCQGLNPQYLPPHRETCWKIVKIIVELLQVRLSPLDHEFHYCVIVRHLVFRPKPCTSVCFIQCGCDALK